MGIILHIVEFLGGTVLVFLGHGKGVGVASLCLFDPGHPEIGLVTTRSGDEVLECFGRIEVANIAVGFGPGRPHAEVLRSLSNAAGRLHTKGEFLVFRTFHL